MLLVEFILPFILYLCFDYVSKIYDNLIGNQVIFPIKKRKTAITLVVAMVSVPKDWFDSLIDFQWVHARKAAHPEQTIPLLTLRRCSVWCAAIVGGGCFQLFSLRGRGPRGCRREKEVVAVVRSVVCGRRRLWLIGTAFVLRGLNWIPRYMVNWSKNRLIPSGEQSPHT